MDADFLPTDCWSSDQVSISSGVLSVEVEHPLETIPVHGNGKNKGSKGSKNN